MIATLVTISDLIYIITLTYTSTISYYRYGKEHLSSYI